ncbi:MAG: ABC transporter permease [Xanthomonadales bacterium]|nr:ABC transporter permease [Xanthomonadales bacterium]
MTTAQLDWRETTETGAVLAIRGACTMQGLPALLAQLAALKRKPATLDLSGLDALDSAGALVLLRLLDGRRRYRDALARIADARPEHQALLQLVADRASVEPAVAARHSSWREWLVKLGEAVHGFGAHALQLATFFGAINHCFWAILHGRRKLRMTSVVHHMERTGLDAVPIVSLLCFLVGAVVAFLSATALRDFGASILTVEIVAVSFLREFGVLLSAILVAGRSGSAFTAEIGSMRSREEIDAIQALALDPIELLVIPRLVALLVMLPVLAFLAMLSGIVGGALVGAMALDISWTMFLVRMQDTTELYYLWLGLLKAPVFAFLIASIGCLEGLKVSGSAESVGRHTTSSVVQSIFLVIVFDALFAVLYMQLDL